MVQLYFKNLGMMLLLRLCSQMHLCLIKLVQRFHLGVEKFGIGRPNRWDTFDAINKVPYIVWGWTAGVFQSSQYQTAAFDFLGYLSNEKNHFNDLKIGNYGINPFRLDDLQPDYWIEQANWDKAIAKDYVAMLHEQHKNPNKVFDLQNSPGRAIHGYTRDWCFKGSFQKIYPPRCFRLCGRTMEALNQTIGVDKQRKAYENVVQLEDNRIIFFRWPVQLSRR